MKLTRTADHQGFFIRSEEFQAQGEFLFVFDIFGTLQVNDIIIPSSTNYYRPTTPSNPISFPLPFYQFRELQNKWDSLVNKWKLNLEINQCHRYIAIDDWLNLLSSTPELNDLCSDFQSIG